MTREANDVGDNGEKKRLSWPAMMEVCSQSKRTSAVRSRTSPVLTLSSAPEGNPPPKSNCTDPLVFAPCTSGPKTSRPSSDCLSVAPKLFRDPYVSVGAAYVG